MKVIECSLYGHLSEEEISNNLVDFVETNYNNRNNFSIKSIPENNDPALTYNKLIGFYSFYGVPYLSNPNNSTGIAGIDCHSKRIIFAFSDKAFYEQRDAYVYLSHTNQYIRETYEEVLNKFLSQGYSFFEFSRTKKFPSIVYYKKPDKIQTKTELQLKDIINI